MFFDVGGDYYAREVKLEVWTKRCNEIMSTINLGDTVKFYSPMNRADCEGVVTEKINFYSIMVVNQERKWSVPVDWIETNKVIN